MDVVGRSADDDGGAFPVFQNAGLVGIKPFANFGAEARIPVFGAVDQVNQILGKRLRLDLFIVSPLQGMG